VGALAVLLGIDAAAQQLTVLEDFSGLNGGAPAGGLIFDQSGNLYGTTITGGFHGAGVAFKLMSSPRGWNEKVLFNFGGASPHVGGYPWGTLLLSASGQIYGVTQSGGADLCVNEHGLLQECGTVFQLTPQADGSWTEQVIHAFNGDGKGTDGWFPSGGLVEDAQGNLYGMTEFGGSVECYYSYPGCGAVYRLSPDGSGGWTESILHSFTAFAPDGAEPIGAPTVDVHGNVYGTTNSGGSDNGGGTAFMLTPESDASWKETILHSFAAESQDGWGPAAGMTIDGKGNLYGTTEYGGEYGYGTVFRLSPSAGGNWTETILHGFSFSAAGGDGYIPSAGKLTLGNGKLFGATQYGGAYLDGTIFQLTAEADGSWSETLLYSFNGQDDQSSPNADLAMDSYGNLFGTVGSFGNLPGYGSAFGLEP
jgi:uncharacterized repeat protein (TIGR03803 family)